MAGCARVYSLRVTGGVERTPSGERDGLVMVSFGATGHVGGRGYIAPSATAGMSVEGESSYVLGGSIEYLKATPSLTVRGGPDYHTRRSFEDGALYHAVGGRAAVLWTFGNTQGDATNGILDEIFGSDEPSSGFMATAAGCGNDCAPSPSGGAPSWQVERRHSIGLEGSAGVNLGGLADEGSFVGFLGVTYEYDILRLD